MPHALHNFLFVVYPYICLAVFLIIAFVIVITSVFLIIETQFFK